MALRMLRIAKGVLTAKIVLTSSGAVCKSLQNSERGSLAQASAARKSKSFKFFSQNV